jgi:hypothetical protein
MTPTMTATTTPTITSTMSSILPGRSAATRTASGVLAVVGAASLALSGCSSDIFDVSVQMGEEAFHLDFGTTTGTVPTVACDPATPAPCGTGGVITLANGAGETELAAGCDGGTARCYMQANTRVFYVVDVLRDDAFTSKVGRKGVTLVRMLDVAYAVPSNTATFDIPRIDVHVGPAEARQVGDAGVTLVDSVPLIAAGQKISLESPGHLTIADESPGRALIESSIKRKAPFVFIVTTEPRMESGSALPSGSIDIVLRPLLGLGVR